MTCYVNNKQLSLSGSAKQPKTCGEQKPAGLKCILVYGTIVTLKYAYVHMFPVTLATVVLLFTKAHLHRTGLIRAIF